MLGSTSLPLRESERMHTEKERADAGCPFCYAVMTFRHNIEGLEVTQCFWKDKRLMLFTSLKRCV